MQKNTHEVEFLPAALEIQETPPSPIGRLIIWLIIALFLTAITWAFYGEINIVATAKGKIVPSGNDKIIQPLEIGIVGRINVNEGQFVNKGDVLIELDSTNALADETRIENSLLQLNLERTRLLTFSKILNQVKHNSEDSPNMSIRLKTNSLLTAQEKLLLRSQIKKYQSKIAILQSEQQRLTASLAEANNYVNKLQQTLPLITERVSNLTKLIKENMASRESYLLLEQQRIEQESDLAAFKNKTDQIKAEKKSTKEKLSALQSETQHTTLLKLSEVDRNITSLEQELVKAKQRNKLQQLIAPISGTIHQLAINTIGGVVTPAQELMIIVPNNKHLEVESFLANKDIGFVETGQTAETKIDTFPFTKYGVIDSTVLQISSDAINDDQLGLVYKMRTSLATSVIQVGNRFVNLSPGMSVSVEIKTGKRRIIDYFFSPLMEYVDESIKER